jgi:hypothetical protein
MVPGGGCSGVYLLNNQRLTTLTANGDVAPNFAGPQCNLNIVAVDIELPRHEHREPLSAVTARDWRRPLPPD